MNDLAAWGVILGMGGYGVVVLTVVRLHERRQALRGRTAGRTGRLEPVLEPALVPVPVPVPVEPVEAGRR